MQLLLAVVEKKKLTMKLLMGYLQMRQYTDTYRLKDLLTQKDSVYLRLNPEGNYSGNTKEFEIGCQILWSISTVTNIRPIADKI